MKRFFDDVRILAGDVWPLALLFMIVAFFTEWMMALPRDPRQYSPIGQIAFFVWPVAFGCAYALLIGYISADARRRGMRDVLWMRLAIFVPYCIGAILYFILRDPLLVPCPKCGAKGRSSFAFCPRCGARISHLNPVCPACKRAVDSQWKCCAHCGAELGNF